MACLVFRWSGWEIGAGCAGGVWLAAKRVVWIYDVMTALAAHPGRSNHTH